MQHPAESHVPTVHRIVAGEFDERAGYATYRSHGTTDWLLIHTVAGVGVFRTQDGDERRAGPGESVLLRPGTCHDYGVDGDLPHWELTFAHFHARPEWLPLLTWPEWRPGVGVINSGPEVGGRIEAHLREAARFDRSGMVQRELFAVNALEAALLWCDTQNPLARRLDERVLRVMEHIDRHLTEPLEVEDLARIAHLSVSRFTHLFSAQVQTSPQRFVEAQRLQLASQLLDLTGRPVSVIAAEVGYADPLYFSHRFKRRTGLSPSAYRSRQRFEDGELDGLKSPFVRNAGSRAHPQ